MTQFFFEPRTSIKLEFISKEANLLNEREISGEIITGFTI